MQQTRRITWICWHSNVLPVKWWFHASQLWNIFKLLKKNYWWKENFLKKKKLLTKGDGNKVEAGGGGKREVVCWCTWVWWCWCWCISVLMYGGGATGGKLLSCEAKNRESNSLLSISAWSATTTKNTLSKNKQQTLKTLLLLGNGLVTGEIWLYFWTSWPVDDASETNTRLCVLMLLAGFFAARKKKKKHLINHHFISQSTNCSIELNNSTY